MRVRPAGTSHADECGRHERIIALLARRPAIRKLQRALDAIAELWRPPAYLHTCFGGRVHWHVRPSSADVATVAGHHEDGRIEVRRAVLAALQHAAPHAHEARAAIALALDDDDVVLRILGARAARELDLGGALADALAQRLDDAVWTVRWHAAAALASMSTRVRAIDALLRSEPSTELARDEWSACARVFADAPAVQQRLRAIE